MTSVKVAVRVRPVNQREDGCVRIIEMEGNTTRITNPKVPECGGEGDHGRDQLKLREFTFDFSFWSACPTDPHFVTQTQVFEALGVDVVSAAYEGYNVCVFAYGQTGSGKTYTMMGSQENPGFIPRFCEDMFSRMNDPNATYRIQVSYLEIYNEKVRDLLKHSNGKPNHRLRIREHPKEGPYVQDLSQHTVVSYDGIASLMNKGNTNRTTAATLMNDVSSRSHAIFTITFTQAKFQDGLPSERQSKIHLVDLAGSERADASGATGQRLKEGGSINRSLVTLGNVISVLAEVSEEKGNRSRGSFIPYRDSILTWLLKDSLGGNAKTIMIATVSPADINYGETLSTLRYANRAKNIINRPTVNEDPNVSLIRELREEIARLKNLLGGNLDNISSPKVQEKLHENEARIKVLTEEWADKWRESASILQEEKNLELRKEGLGVVLDSTLPHLIGIDDDILSTGIMLYHLKEGITTIGTDDSDEHQDIMIAGVEVEPQHCVIEYLSGMVTLHPIEDALCAVNGIVVTEPVKLTQGAVILLGRTNMFRFNHPAEAQKLKQMRKSLSTLSLSPTPVLNNSRTSLLSHSMTDLYRSNDSLAVAVGNLGSHHIACYMPSRANRSQSWEFEENHREEQELLDSKRQEIEEMEERYRQQESEWHKTQAHMEQELQEKERQLMELQQEIQTIKITMSPAQSIEEALQRLAEQEQRQVQEMQRLREELTQELLDLGARHTTSQSSIIAALADLDQRLGTHQVHVAALKDENAHRRDALQADRQKEEKLANILRSELMVIREHLKTERERVFSQDARLKEKYTSLTEKDAELRKTHAQIDTEKNAEWKKILDGLSEENYRIEEAWHDLTEQEAAVNQRLESGQFVTEAERMECENDKDQLLQARVLLKEEEDRIAAAQQSEMERVESEMEKWTQQKENEISALEQEKDALLRQASKEMSALLVQANTKLAAITQQQEKCHDVESLLTRLDEEMRAQLADLMREQRKLEEQKNKKTEERQLGEKEKKKAETDIHDRLTQLQVTSDREMQKIHEERKRLLGLRKLSEEQLLNSDGDCKDTTAADIMEERQKALEERTQECAHLQEQLSHLQEELSSRQRQVDEERDRELDAIEFKKLQLQDLERQERINALVEQEVKRRLFEEKVEREKQRRMEREKERQDREKEIQRLKSLHEREIRQLRAKLENNNGISRSTPYTNSSSPNSSFEENRKKLVHQLSSTGPPPTVHITIPNYALRGAGREAHYEYEVKVKIGDEIWSVFRRYSRFRELHQTLRKRYSSVDILVFPPRKLFHKTEKVAAERRFLLEQYLNNLLEVCTRHPACPLHPDNNRYLTKHILAEFDSFFRRGLFEHARHIAT